MTASMSTLDSPLECPGGANAPLEEVAARFAARKWQLLSLAAVWFAAAISSEWIPTSDSALYLMLGRSLAHGEGYTLAGKPHTFVPPGYPMLIAALDRCGLGSMFCLNAAMAVLGLLLVWLSGRLLREMTSKRAAVLIACIVGLNAALHAISARQLSDVPFTVLVLAGLWMYRQGLQGKGWQLELGTLAIIASCWMRLAGVALVVGCPAGLLLEPRRVSRLRIGGNVVALLGVVAGSAGLFFLRYRHGSQTPGFLPPASYFASIAPELRDPMQFWLWGPLANAYKSTVELSRYLLGQELHPIVAGVLFALPISVGLWNRAVRRDLLIPSALLAYLGGVILILPAADRYLLPFAPVLTLYFLEGLSSILSLAHRSRRFSSRNAVPRVLFAVVAGLLLFNGIKGIGGLRRNRDMIARRHAELDETIQLLKSEARPGENFVSCEKERELAYLSGVPSIQLDRGALVSRIPVPDYPRFLFEHGVRLLVIAPESSQSLPDARLVRKAVEDTRLFKPLNSQGRYRVYRFQSLTPVSLTTANEAGQ